MKRFLVCRLIEKETAMDQCNDPRELQRQLEQAARLASATTDQTTYQRLREFVEELRRRLQRVLAARRSKEEIRARARELWDQHGRPAGRDLDFWLQAERELSQERKGQG
jgi:predicted RNA-binding Zn ribbon-like protein